MKFVPLTAELLEQYMGRQPKTIQGFALMNDAEVVGVIGLTRSGGDYILFARVNDDVWDYSIASKRLVIQGVRKLQPLMDQKKRLFAFADEDREGACFLLDRMGFRRREDGSYRC